MEKQIRDEKSVKEQILYLMNGEDKGVSFDTLLSVLDMSDQDRSYLHILLLDLCREGKLEVQNDGYSSMDDTLFFPANEEKNGLSLKTEKTENPGQIEEKENKEKTAESEVGEVSSQPEEAPDEYAVGLYQYLKMVLKNGGEWKSVRDLLLQRAWPKTKEACGVLPALLIQMASEGIIEIKTEKDKISSVRPSIRYCAENDEKNIPGAIEAILKSVPAPKKTDEDNAGLMQTVTGEIDQKQILVEKSAIIIEKADMKEYQESVQAEEISVSSDENVAVKAELSDVERPDTDDTREDEEKSEPDDELTDDDWQDRTQVLYGYKDTPDGYVIVEREAEVIRAIFKMRARKMILQAITDRLNNAGIRTKSGKTFYPATVSSILMKHRLYKGEKARKNCYYPVILDEGFMNRYNAISDDQETANIEEEQKQERVHEKTVDVSSRPVKLPDPKPTFESETVSDPEPVKELTTQEEIQEEIYRTLYENPGYHSVDGIKSLNGNLNRIADYKIIFNANTLKARNLVDEIITSPPDQIMYLYAAKVQVSVQPPEQAEKKGETVDGGITDDRDILDFMEYCRTTPLSYAYKMVLLLAFMKYADSLGSLHIDNAVQYFRMFYNNRRSKGLRVEKGNTIFADPGASDHMLRRNIIDNPIKALKGGGYFKYDATNQMLIMRYFVWSKLTDGYKEQIVEICHKRVEEYFRGL